MQCDGCQVLYINGERCHERGCPEAWKEQEIDCFQCGFAFLPEHRHQKTCSDCINCDDFDHADCVEAFEDYVD